MNKAPRPNTEYHRQKIGKINVLLKEFHGDKWGTLSIKNPEAAKRYGGYAQELSQVLIELRDKDSFSSTWAGKTVHLIYKNKKEGKVFSREYTLTTPDDFLKDAAEYVSTGPVFEEEISPDTPPPPEPPPQEPPQQEDFKPYRAPWEQQHGETTDDYLKRRAREEDLRTQEAINKLEKERNIYFDFNEQVDQITKIAIVDTILSSHPGTGNKDWLLNTVIKINPFTNSPALEREKGRQTLYMPKSLYREQVNHDLGRIFYEISQGKNPKELEGNLAFEAAQTLVVDYKLRGLNFGRIKTRECLEISLDLIHMMKRFGADANYLRDCYIDFEDINFKSEFYPHNNKILIDANLWKKGGSEIEKFLAYVISKIKQNSR